MLKGATKAKTLVVDDGFFHRRAQAVTTHAARKVPAAPVPAGVPKPGTAEATDAEARRMRDAEWVVGREAILYVDQLKAEADVLRARLRYRTYEDAQKAALDPLEKAIAAPPDRFERERL